MRTPGDVSLTLVKVIACERVAERPPEFEKNFFRKSQSRRFLKILKRF